MTSEPREVLSDTDRGRIGRLHFRALIGQVTRRPWRTTIGRAAAVAVATPATAAAIATHSPLATVATAAGVAAISTAAIWVSSRTIGRPLDSAQHRTWMIDTPDSYACVEAVVRHDRRTGRVMWSVRNLVSWPGNRGDAARVGAALLMDADRDHATVSISAPTRRLRDRYEREGFTTIGWRGVYTMTRPPRAPIGASPTEDATADRAIRSATNDESSPERRDGQHWPSFGGTPHLEETARAIAQLRDATRHVRLAPDPPAAGRDTGPGRPPGVDRNNVTRGLEPHQDEDLSR